MKELIEKILSNPVGAGIVGLILFILIPGLRVYISIIAVVIFIAIAGKNGFVLYFAYSSFGAFLSFLLSLINENSEIYHQIDAALSILTFATIGNIIDLIFYATSNGWNGLANFIAFLGFGAIALLINKAS